MSSKEFWINHFSKTFKEVLDTFLNLRPESCQEVLSLYGIKGQTGTIFESAENRVFGFEDLIVKFYRPGRWSKEALDEELQNNQEIKNCWGQGKSIWQEGTWYNKPLSHNIKILQESCLGSAEVQVQNPEKADI
ncbi:MAG: hypothetical protein ACPGJV_13965 [Bacteriovoracaceae bacterium]